MDYHRQNNRQEYTQEYLETRVWTNDSIVIFMEKERKTRREMQKLKWFNMKGEQQCQKVTTTF